MPSRRSVLQSLGVSALGMSTLIGSSVAAATSAESLQSREPTEFGTKETKVVNELYGPEDPVGYLSTSVTGYDSFPKERDDIWFSAVSSAPIMGTGGFNTTSLVHSSIEVKPRSIPEETAPRIDSIDTFREGNQITLEDDNRETLVKGLNLIWDNTVNRVAPISLPAPDFGVGSDYTADIDKDYWRGNTNAAFSTEWGTDSEIVATHSRVIPVLTADFQLSFRAAGTDGYTLQGTYIYDVIFEATFRHPLLGGDHSDYRTVTHEHTINFVVGDSDDDDGVIGCGITDPICSTG